jgi:hypothetical protein
MAGISGPERLDASDVGTSKIIARSSLPGWQPSGGQGLTGQRPLETGSRSPTNPVPARPSGPWEGKLP